MIDPFLLNSLHCPKCQGELTSKSAHLNCASCKVKFGKLNEIHWLFAYPESSWSDWRERIQYHLKAMAADMGAIQSAISENKSPAGQIRLKKIGEGLQVNFNVVGELLKPMAAPTNKSLNVYEATKSELPLAQKLMGYEANIHRDWCWGADEINAQLGIIERLKPAGHKWGKVLILGAGTGRLGLDLSLRDSVEEIVILDINPLLLSFGKAMCEGQKIEFFEFPLAPLSADKAAVREVCQSPRSVTERLHWVLADGMNPPFKPNTFDTVITPWFIDVIPQDLSAMSGRINRILKLGGRWLNFGPYGFIQAPISRQYSREEVLERAQNSGFRMDASSTEDVPYLHSPHSGQKRTESVLTFWAEKTQEVASQPQYKHYPDWLTDLDQPIPKQDRLLQYHFATQLQSEVLAQIDGQATIRSLSENFAKTRGLSSEDALGAVAMLLRRLWDGA